MEADAGSGSARPGPGRSLCLNAIVVALNETCDGKNWYTSTKELQLASLGFCTACRNYQIVHIPRRLLAAADAPPPHPKRLCRTRVPRLKARRVTWNMPTAAALRNPVFAMTDVEYLEFGGDFEGSLEAVAWPRWLKTIDLGPWSNFDKPIDLIEWPDSLQTLEFGWGFNQPMDRVKFPASLQQSIFWGDSLFNQPIAGAILPSTLRLLRLGASFNHPIEAVVWPPSLQELIFDIHSCFNHPVEDVAWPPSLQQLTFGQILNKPIARAKFPASLQQLSFGWYFNQPIEGVLWPDSLQRLVFGTNFNQPVDNVMWPSSLQELTFRCIDLSNDGFPVYSSFNQRIDRSAWPASLRRLTLGYNFKQSLQGLGTWMPNLGTFHLLDCGPRDEQNMLRGIEWPKGLRRLTVFEGSTLVDGVVIPATVEVYRQSLSL